MGCGASKIDSELLKLCRERKVLVKATRDSWYALGSSHVKGFESMFEVQSQLISFIEEALMFSFNSVSAAVAEGEIMEEARSREFIFESNNDEGNEGEGEGDEDDGAADYIPSPDSSDVEDICASEPQPEIVSREAGPLGNSALLRYKNFRNHEINLLPYMYNTSESQVFTQRDSMSLEPNSGFNVDGAEMYSGEQPGNLGLFQHENGMAGHYFLDNHQNLYGQSVSPRLHDSSSWEQMNGHGLVESAHTNFYFEEIYDFDLGSDVDFNEVREREGIPPLEDKFGHRVEDTIGEDDVEFTEDDVEQNEDSEEYPSEVYNVNQGQDAYHEQSEAMNDISVGQEWTGKQDLEANSSPSVAERKRKEGIKNLKISCDQQEEKMEKSESLEQHGMSRKTEGKMASSMSKRDLPEQMNRAFDDIITHGEDVSRLFGPHEPAIASTTGLSFCYKFTKASSRATSGLTHMMFRRLARSILKTTSNNRQNETDMALCSMSLTLEKLCIWERKLYKEVKGEEKFRQAYDNAWRKFTSLTDNGAELSRIGSTHLFLKKLTSRISVAISVIEGIAATTHRLRDEELYPHICEFIDRYHKLWKKLAEAHTLQVLVITKAQAAPRVTYTCSDLSIKAFQSLELAIKELGKALSEWIKSYKEFTNLLMNWLMKFILPNREANPTCSLMPAVLAMCCTWSNAAKQISDAQVLQALNNLSALLELSRLKMIEEQCLRLKMDDLSSYHEKQLRRSCEDSHVDWEEYVAFVAEAEDNAIIMASKFAALHECYLSLGLFRANIKEARAKHEVDTEELSAMSPNLIQDRLIPAFRALQDFSSRMCNSLEQIITVLREQVI